jgi:hypothetical protein
VSIHVVSYCPGFCLPMRIERYVLSYLCDAKMDLLSTFPFCEPSSPLKVLTMR